MSRRPTRPPIDLTDNAAVFTGKPRGGGRVALELELDLLGVKLDHSRPRHPQTCGKVERFHQTQKKWLAAQPPAATLAELQRQLEVTTHETRKKQIGDAVAEIERRLAEMQKK